MQILLFVANLECHLRQNVRRKFFTRFLPSCCTNTFAHILLLIYCNYAIDFDISASTLLTLSDESNSILNLYSFRK